MPIITYIKTMTSPYDTKPARIGSVMLAITGLMALVLLLTTMVGLLTSLAINLWESARLESLEYSLLSIASWTALLIVFVGGIGLLLALPALLRLVRFPPEVG